MAALPPPPDYACEPARDGDIPAPPLTVTPVSFEDADGWTRDVRAELLAAQAAGAMTQEHSMFERSYISGGQMRLYQWYGATFYAVRDPSGEPVGLHVAKPGRSPRKNAWGRYVNHYLAYTTPARRRQGYATAAELALQAQWAAEGYDRLKTLCQSWLGVCYHEHLRDRMWGLNEHGELIIDSPLDPEADFPDGVPVKARLGARHEDRELTPADLTQILADPAGRFRRSTAEIEAVLAKRAYRRPVTVLT